MTLGEKLISLRNNKGISQDTLANGIGVSSETLAEWEQNTREPGRKEIIKICEYFNVPVEYIVYDNVLKPDASGKHKGAGFLALGLVLLFVTAMSTFPAKLYEFAILGESLAREGQYLTKFPFSFGLIISLVLIALGIYKLAKKTK